MKLAMRPIRYTACPEAMRDWAVRLGMVALLDTEGWIVLGAAGGRLAIHAVPDGDPLDRTTTLAVETDDLDAVERLWSHAGMTTRRTNDHDIPLLFATTPLGGEIAAGAWSGDLPASGPEPGLAVMPMLVSDDVEAAADWFTSWGMRRRISSDGGGWVDLDLPSGEGLVGIHAASNLESEPPQEAPEVAGEPHEVAVSLTFEHPDVDALLERVQAAGLEDAHVVDEAYNRTLLVDCPDGETIWVNGAQTDLYGYSRG